MVQASPLRADAETLSMLIPGTNVAVTHDKTKQ